MESSAADAYPEVNLGRWSARPVPSPVQTIPLDARRGLYLVSLGMKGEAIKGHLDLLLLSVLAEAPLHGYAVIEQLRERSADVFDLPEGTVYPALHRLERQRMIKSRWESGQNARRRRLYSLTPTGRRQLKERRVQWSGFVTAVTSVVGDN